jgi:hypothetical protein
MVLYGILSLSFVFPFLSSIAAITSSFSDAIAGMIILGSPAVLFILLFLKARRGYVNYTQSSVYKNLQGLGGVSADEFCVMINSEVLKSALFSHKRLTLTGRWVIIQGRFSLCIFPAAELVWAYMYVMNGTFYQVIFALRNRGRHSIHTLREKVCVETLTGVARSYPHVLTGYSKENMKLYKEICGR